jgi:heat shock protein HslJ
MKNVSHISRLLVLLIFLGLLVACSRASSDSLTGTVWQWTAMQETVPASQSVVPKPKNYTIIFNTDGSAIIKADCNNVTGTYTMSGSSLTIALGASTQMACGDASLDTIYLASLAKVSSYAIVNGDLQLKFANDGGKMDFKNGGKAP